MCKCPGLPDRALSARRAVLRAVADGRHQRISAILNAPPRPMRRARPRRRPLRLMLPSTTSPSSTPTTRASPPRRSWRRCAVCRAIFRCRHICCAPSSSASAHPTMVSERGWGVSASAMRIHITYTETPCVIGCAQIWTNYVNRPLPKGGNGYGAVPRGSQATQGALGMGEQIAVGASSLEHFHQIWGLTSCTPRRMPPRSPSVCWPTAFPW